MQLTPHFKLEEFTRSGTAMTYALDNTPNEEQLENIRFLCKNVLEPLRAAFGPIIISSGFRSTEVNRHPSIKGNPNSQHLKGEACDIVLPSIEIGRKYFEFLKRLPLFDQLIWEVYSPKSSKAWIHVSVRRTGRNRKEVLPLLYKHPA